MKQLEETAKIIDWAVNQISKERLLENPPHGNHPNATDYIKGYFGKWSAYRILFHLVFYEENHVISSLKKYLEESVAISENELNEEDAWNSDLVMGVNVDDLLKRLHLVRKMQIKIINRIDENQWSADTGHTSCLHSSPEFITSKTIQHTLEHGNKLLRIALFWDSHLQMLDQKKKNPE